MTVFVMIPYRDTFRETYRTAIEPVLKANGLEPVVGENHVTPGPVDEQIVASIRDARFCVADLTGPNPNVVYEVALAHSLRKPVILLTRDDLGDIPFDVRHHRALKYAPTAEGHARLAQMLHEAVKAILASEQSVVHLLKRMLAPSSIETSRGGFVVVASPLSYRAAFRRGGGWRKRPLTTFSDNVGIRGLMQSFGLIYGLERLPELLNPDDFDDEVLEKPENRVNMYAIGSPKANRWTGILMEGFFANRKPKWEFKPDPESREIMNPRVIVRRDGHEFRPHVIGDPHILKWDFGLVIRGPHPMDASFMFMVLAGRSSLGTEAACLAVTDPVCLKKLDERLRFEGINADDHREAFCTIVSIKAPDMKTDKDEFRVCDVIRY
ncbi:MAG TPA: hypothetical protein VNE39_15360 [Planctomycetota bacterium]|nr:hypothetical protein [Planctomycetota bacterium]